jgi:hypothetical protein
VTVLFSFIAGVAFGVLISLSRYHRGPSGPISHDSPSDTEGGDYDL